MPKGRPRDSQDPIATLIQGEPCTAQEPRGGPARAFAARSPPSGVSLSLARRRPRTGRGPRGPPDPCRRSGEPAPLKRVPADGRGDLGLARDFPPRPTPSARAPGGSRSPARRLGRWIRGPSRPREGLSGPPRPVQSEQGRGGAAGHPGRTPCPFTSSGIESETSSRSAGPDGTSIRVSLSTSPGPTVGSCCSRPSRGVGTWSGPSTAGSRIGE